MTVDLGANPHGVLGAHEAEDGGVVVRTLRPEAQAVRVQPAGIEAELKDPAGLWEALLPKARLPLKYELEVEYPDGNTFTVRDPYSFLPTLGELDLHLAMEGRHEQLYERLGAHVRELDGVVGTAFAVWAPNARSVSVVGDFNSWDGRLYPMRSLGESGIWELFVPGVERRDEVQVRDPDAGRPAAPEERPARLPHRGAAGKRLGRLGGEARLARRGVARAPGGRRPAARSDVGLRGPPRLVAAQPARGQSPAELPRARGRARRLRLRPRLHARRAAAGDGASLLRLLGLPGDRLLRADLALRHARRLPPPRRPPPPARHRRDPRLGARPLPARRLGARHVRRDAPLRARRPAPRLPSRLGHARLQPRPDGGAELPARERALLAAGAPRRRDPRRRRRLDALPRLLTQGGRVGAEPVRRQRGPRVGRLPQGVERDAVRARAGRDLDRRGVDRVARRVPADLPRRTRLRLQVEPGLDARHPHLLPEGPGLPTLPPPHAHLLAHVCVQRELRPAAVARRGRARQAVAARQDARRPLAEVREPALALRLHVGAPRQEAPLHGRRARRVGGVERRGLAPLEPARARRARGDPGAGARPQPPLPLDSVALGARLRPGRLPLARGERHREQRPRFRAGRREGCAAAGLRPQPFAGAAPRLPRRDARLLPLAGGAEHGLGLLRRQRRRQPRRGRERRRCRGTSKRSRPR